MSWRAEANVPNVVPAHTRTIVPLARLLRLTYRDDCTEELGDAIRSLVGEIKTISDTTVRNVVVDTQIEQMLADRRGTT